MRSIVKRTWFTARGDGRSKQHAVFVKDAAEEIVFPAAGANIFLQARHLARATP